MRLSTSQVPQVYLADERIRHEVQPGVDGLGRVRHSGTCVDSGNIASWWHVCLAHTLHVLHKSSCGCAVEDVTDV
jgi:hypothetical protein